MLQMLYPWKQRHTTCSTQVTNVVSSVTQLAELRLPTSFPCYKCCIHGNNVIQLAQLRLPTSFPWKQRHKTYVVLLRRVAVRAAERHVARLVVRASGLRPGDLRGRSGDPGGCASRAKAASVHRATCRHNKYAFQRKGRTTRQYPKIGGKKISVFFHQRRALSTSFDTFVVTYRVTNFLPKLVDMLLFPVGKN